MIVTEHGIKKKAKELTQKYEAESGNLNEADTRARYIDDFLNAFGWKSSDSDVAREKHVKTADGSGFVDYVLKLDGVDQVVIEAKRLGHAFTDEDIKQLADYFNATTAHVGVLSNGIEYWFFSWEEKKHRMDLRPFARINICHLDVSRRDNFVMYLKRNAFDVKRMKWVSHADFIRWSIYILLGKDHGGNNSTLAWNVFQAKFSGYKIDDEPVDYYYVKDLFEFTKHHSRYNYLRDISEW